jgi:glycosyltransferase involved in cell wall biosynthesis
MPDVPLISIITATFNAAEQLPHTLASLRAQTFRNFEWIVIDGGSTDGTPALLRDAQDMLSYWVSEPDSGIYDAWNKGCARARGEWLMFLGAGDVLAAPDVFEGFLATLAASGKHRPLVYGRALLLSALDRQPMDELGQPWPQLRDKWEIGRPALPPHGATLHHRSLFADKTPFDTRYRIAADSKMLLGAIRIAPPAYVDCVLVGVPIGGVSFRFGTARAVAAEVRAINRELGIRVPMGERFLEGLRLGILDLLRMLPERLAHRVADGLRAAAGCSARWSVR